MDEKDTQGIWIIVRWVSFVVKEEESSIKGDKVTSSSRVSEEQGWTEINTASIGSVNRWQVKLGFRLTPNNYPDRSSSSLTNSHCQQLSHVQRTSDLQHFSFTVRLPDVTGLLTHLQTYPWKRDSDLGSNRHNQHLLRVFQKSPRSGLRKKSTPPIAKLEQAWQRNGSNNNLLPFHFPNFCSK